MNDRGAFGAEIFASPVFSCAHHSVSVNLVLLDILPDLDDCLIDNFRQLIQLLLILANLPDPFPFKTLISHLLFLVFGPNQAHFINFSHSAESFRRCRCHRDCPTHL